LHAPELVCFLNGVRVSLLIVAMQAADMLVFFFAELTASCCAAVTMQTPGDS